MKQIFVIGPSGVGKTTLCHQVSGMQRTIVHVSFDEQVKMLVDVHYPLPQLRTGEEGREFWNFCKGVIDNLSQQTDSDIVLLFDVDAGAEYIPECQAYLIERSESLICLTADPAIIYQREVQRAAALGNPPRDKTNFFDTEYSEVMQQFYDTASVMIDVSDEDVETSAERLRTAIDALREK